MSNINEISEKFNQDLQDETLICKINQNNGIIKIDPINNTTDIEIPNINSIIDTGFIQNNKNSNLKHHSVVKISGSTDSVSNILQNQDILKKLVSLTSIAFWLEGIFCNEETGEVIQNFFSKDYLDNNILILNNVKLINEEDISKILISVKNCDKYKDNLYIEKLKLNIQSKENNDIYLNLFY